MYYFFENIIQYSIHGCIMLAKQGWKRESKKKRNISSKVQSKS